MKPPQNSDSITHVKKQNPTSKTEIRRKSLKYLFLETPCTNRNTNTNINTYTNTNTNTITKC